MTVRTDTPCELCGTEGSFWDSADDFGPSLFCAGCGVFVREAETVSERRHGNRVLLDMAQR